MNKGVLFLIGAFGGFVLASVFFKTPYSSVDKEHAIWEYGVGS